MSYYHSRRVKIDFENTISAVTESLKKEGFSVLTQINIAEKLKEKIGINFRKYVILGACNPSLAFLALQAEDKIGVMLPCNIVVQEKAPGNVEIAAIDPVGFMHEIDNPSLNAVASEVSRKLKRVVDSV